MAISDKLAQMKERAENDLFYFAQLVNPHYIYGDIHREFFRWLQEDEGKDHMLGLLPRAHLKSHCIAVWCVWKITRDPTTTIVYLSAGDDLAKAQVYAIKNMITCDDYRMLWPDMLHEQEGKRDKWSADGFNVDHPLRKEMGIRDSTIIVKTIKSNATGLHCSDLVMDDVVVPQNAYTDTGRREVKAAVSQFASIKNPGAKTKIVGTRYHPQDIYHNMLEAKLPILDDLGNIISEQPLYEVFERRVEDSGDGAGNFLWPRVRDPKTKNWYGFDQNVLSGIKAQYFSLGERAQYFAQYYNEPNDPESNRLSQDVFQYYDKKHLTNTGGSWFFKGEKLNVFAAVDFAFTDSTSSDYTAVAVIGRTADGKILVLDLDRFRTTKYDKHYRHILDMHIKWGFRKIRVETNAGANVICEFIKDKIRQEGHSFVLDGRNVSGKTGSKEQRIAAILEPRYENGDMWHHRSGLTLELEQELMMERPPHDDLKDSLAAAVEISKPPTVIKTINKRPVVSSHPRFGGLIR